VGIESRTSGSKDCNELSGLNDTIEVIQDTLLGVVRLQKCGCLCVSLIDRILQILPAENNFVIILTRILVVFL
jgi:hypothetical protein